MHVPNTEQNHCYEVNFDEQGFGDLVAHYKSIINVFIIIISVISNVHANLILFLWFTMFDPLLSKNTSSNQQEEIP